MCLGDDQLPSRDRGSTLRPVCGGVRRSGDAGAAQPHSRVASRGYALNDEFEGARNPEGELCNSLQSPTPSLDYSYYA